MNVSMALFSTTEKGSKVGVKIMVKLWLNDVINCFKILSHTSNMLFYASVTMIFLILLAYIITIILQ